MFDWLVSWTIFSVGQRIMCEHEESRQLHQCREPHCRPGIVAEDEEGGAKGPQLGQRQAIHDRCHGVFTDTVVQIPSAWCVRLEVAGSSECEGGLVRWPKIG